MTEADLIKTIRQVVRREIAQMMLCTVTSTEDQYTGSMQRFANEGEIENLRQMKPFGLASRAPSGTTSIAAPIAGDPTHLIMLSEFDPGNRPDIDEGETALYAMPLKQTVYLDKQGNINVGSLDSDEPLVLGNVLQSFCDELMDIIKTALQAIVTGPVAITTTPGNPAPTNPVLISALNNALAQLAVAKSQYVDTTATNFLSLKNFTEKGGP